MKKLKDVDPTQIVATNLDEPQSQKTVDWLKGQASKDAWGGSSTHNCT